MFYLGAAKSEMQRHSAEHSNMIYDLLGLSLLLIMTAGPAAGGCEAKLSTNAHWMLMPSTACLSSRWWEAWCSRGSASTRGSGQMLSRTQLCQRLQASKEEEAFCLPIDYLLDKAGGKPQWKVILIITSNKETKDPSSCSADILTT